MLRCYPNIYRCIQCLSWHCQSVLILWHFMTSLDLFNFSLRGTKNHPKKPAFSSNICPDCISCHLEFQNFPGEGPGSPANQEWGHPPLGLIMPMALGGMSSLRLLPKTLHLLKNFLRTLLFVNHFIVKEVDFR